MHAFFFHLEKNNLFEQHFSLGHKLPNESHTKNKQNEKAQSGPK